MKSSEPLLFIALLPPMEVQNEVTQIKQYFAQNYNSSHALKSPPHVTLQPPFKWLTEDFDLLKECLTEFAKTYAPIPITLSGFGSFPPRVIYVNVIKTPELMEIQNIQKYTILFFKIIFLQKKTNKQDKQTNNTAGQLNELTCDCLNPPN
jgi:2'-5' RNA ligase